MKLETWTVTLALAALTLLATSGAAWAGDAAAGKAPFTMNCASCHGETGHGDGPVGAVLDPPPRDFSKAEFKFDANGDGKAGTDEDLTLVIRNGAAKYGGSALMAPWPTLKDEEVANIIAYIRTLQQ